MRVTRRGLARGESLNNAAPIALRLSHPAIAWPTRRRGRSLNNAIRREKLRRWSAKPEYRISFLQVNTSLCAVRRSLSSRPPCEVWASPTILRFGKPNIAASMLLAMRSVVLSMRSSMSLKPVAALARFSRNKGRRPGLALLLGSLLAIVIAPVTPGNHLKACHPACLR